jgi:hypothetical protein
MDAPKSARGCDGGSDDEVRQCTFLRGGVCVVLCVCGLFLRTACLKVEEPTEDLRLRLAWPNRVVLTLELRFANGEDELALE